MSIPLEEDVQVYEAEVDVDSLLEHPKNPHNGDVDAVAEIIRANGFFGVIKAQTSTRTIIAGHTTWKACKKLGMRYVPVIWKDVDDNRALAHVIADNRAGQLGTFNDAMLAAALDELAALGELASTGFDESYLTDLQKVLDNVHPYAVPTGQGTSASAGQAIVNPSFSDIKDQYAANGVRSLILDFGLAEYEALVPRLQAARAALDVTTNGALLVSLLDVFESALDGGGVDGVPVPPVPEDVSSQNGDGGQLPVEPASDGPIVDAVE